MYDNPNISTALTFLAMTLPVINKYLVDFLQKLGVQIDGKTLSRNTGIVLVAIFAGLGLITVPHANLGALPTQADAIQWLTYAAGVVTYVGTLLAWVIEGARHYNDKVTPPEPDPEPMPPEPPAFKPNF